MGRVREALDDDRLLLYAQPIVDAASGDVVQHELLLRMRGPTGTILAASDFLPSAERFGLIRRHHRLAGGQDEQGAQTLAPSKEGVPHRIGDDGWTRRWRRQGLGERHLDRLGRSDVRPRPLAHVETRARCADL